MGRVARYKKVKKSLSKATPRGADRISINNNGKDSKGSLDYFDRVGVWGLGDSGRTPKKRSMASLKLRAQRNKGKVLPDARETFDLGCTEGDDFDMNDLVGSLKKEQRPLEETTFTAISYATTTTTATKDAEQTSASKVTADIPSNDNESSTTSPTILKSQLPVVVTKTPMGSGSTVIEMDDERLHKKFEKQVKPNVSTIVKSEGRMMGESKNAYSKRVKQETRQIIQRANQQAHNPEKRLKKKEFLTLKKKNGNNKKRKNKFIDNDDDDDDDNNNIDYDDNDNSSSKQLLTGEQAVAARARATKVQFGEQAERPPQFLQLPRGAHQLKKQKTTTTGTSDRIKTQTDIDADAVAMDKMRQKVQAQYAEIKARRRNNGDFHL